MIRECGNVAMESQRIERFERELELRCDEVIDLWMCFKVR